MDEVDRKVEAFNVRPVAAASGVEPYFTRPATVILLIDEQFRKESFTWIVWASSPGTKFTVCRLEQFWNALVPMLSVVEGIVTDVRLLQP